MSLNVYNEYIKIERNLLLDCASLCLDQYFNKKIFDSLLTVYFDVRYGNCFDDMKNVNIKKNILTINKRLISKALDLTNDKNKDSVNYMLYFFGFIYQIMGYVGNSDISLIVDDINRFRNDKLGLEEVSKNDILDLVSSYKKRKSDFFQAFEDNNFDLVTKSTNVKNKYDVLLSHNVKIPKLYSDYAISNVFNNGIIAENKLFVEYYMICLRILVDISMFKYDISYIVEYCDSLRLKTEKNTRLLKIIDNNIFRDRVIMKINYLEFVNNKDFYCDLIHDGYKFALVIDSNFVFDMSNTIMLSLFEVVIVYDKEILAKMDKFDNLVWCS